MTPPTAPSPPLAQDIGGVIEVVDDLAFGVEPRVVEDQNQFGISGDRLLFIHDDHAMEPAPELFAGKGLNQMARKRFRRRRNEVLVLSPGLRPLHTRAGVAASISLAILMPRQCRAVG